MAAKLMLLCFGWEPCGAAASAAGPAVATAGLLIAAGVVHVSSPHLPLSSAQSALTKPKS